MSKQEEIKPEQVRAARALLDWSRDELANKTKLSADTIRRIEMGSLQPRATSQAVLRRVFEAEGVEFLPRGGVAMRDDSVQVLEGAEAYIRLLNDIAATLPNLPVAEQEVLFMCAGDRMLSAEAAFAEDRLRRAGYALRFLVEEGTAQIGNAHEYRQLPPNFYHHALQVIYADKTAQQLSGSEKIVLMRDANVAAQSRKIFEQIWLASATAASTHSNTKAKK